MLHPYISIPASAGTFMWRMLSSLNLKSGVPMPILVQQASMKSHGASST